MSASSAPSHDIHAEPWIHQVHRGSRRTVNQPTSLSSALFALVQVGSALVMYGKVSFVQGRLGSAHCTRWSGRIAFLVAVPVAVRVRGPLLIKRLSGG
jgi:hypothetical protein